jgi:predicted ABC-type ATPase
VFVAAGRGKIKRINLMGKKLIIVGGANGVGKTTFAYQYKEEYGITYLGADEIAQEISTSNAVNKEIKAGKEFFRRLEHFLLEKQSVIIESTLSGLGLAKRIERFKEQGYAIHMIYVYLDDVELCKKRIRFRVKKGGHNVPPKDIERRFQRSLQNFRKTYLSLADTWQLLYNGINRPIEVAIGENKQIMIIEEDFYKIFKEMTE